MDVVDWIRNLNLLIHIGAGLFWLGWMVFIFLFLMPVLREQFLGNPERILDPLTKRIRRIVFWLILLIVGTGLVNVYFTRLYKTEILLETDYGHRFLVKLGAALILFSVYAVAPRLTGGTSEIGTEAEENSNSGNNTIMITLHLIAFLSGLIAAFIGLTL
jgi:putative copper export protein